MLEVGDGQQLCWQVHGNPLGRPAVVLHGGPGSGTSGTASWWAGFFDPRRYRVVLLDQRGAGRSTPSVQDPTTDLSVNTTAHLLADIELLREHLRIERWLVLGCSWGVTLGLSYALAHPERVTEAVFFAVTTGRAAGVEWITRGVASYLPEAHERFLAALPAAERDGDLTAAYARLLASPDPAVRQAAADAWCDWEQALAAMDADPEPGVFAGRYADPRFRYGFARMVTHYWSNGCFLAPDAVVGRLDRLAGIPAALVHGRLDLGGPAVTAFEVHRRWPGSSLEIVPGVGHAGAQAMNAAVVRATDRFASSI